MARKKAADVAGLQALRELLNEHDVLLTVCKGPRGPQIVLRLGEDAAPQVEQPLSPSTFQPRAEYRGDDLAAILVEAVGPPAGWWAERSRVPVQRAGASAPGPASARRRGQRRAGR